MTFKLLFVSSNDTGEERHVLKKWKSCSYIR